MASAVSDETGSGSLVFATSPTLVTPALGTPASGTLTNCTFPILNQNTTGTAGGLSSTLAISSGGTGLTTVAKGSILVANTVNTLSALDGGGTNGFLYYTGGTDTISWTTQSTTRSNLGLGTGDSPTFTGLTIGDGSNSGTITSNSSQDLVLQTNGGTNSGTITITDGAGGNIILTPNGTGDVVLAADTVTVGDSGAAATISSNGAGNLTLQTGSGTTGTITMTDGANGNITLTPNGTGDVTINSRLKIASGDTKAQSIDKTTAVTLNARTGRITTTNDLLNKATSVSFQVNNSTITENDVIITNVISTSVGPNTNIGYYVVTANRIASGSFYITIANINHSDNYSDAIVIQFVAITGAIS